MNLYIVRHGDALSELQDSLRPLSNKGERDVRLVGNALSGLEVSAIHHSPKARAAQTARILADCLGHAGTVIESDGLKPNDDPDVWAERLMADEGDIMLVGHLPHVSALASSLISGGHGGMWFAFEPRAVMCLSREHGPWWIRWTLSPGLLGRRTF